MLGCPKHTRAFDSDCGQCKLLVKVAKDTIAGKKITYFHPFKKEDIELKVQQLAEEAKAQEASPFCVRHFPNGGVRCHACIARQMTPEQKQHCDVQATIFGTPMPCRPEELQVAEVVMAELRRTRSAQAVSQADVTATLLAAGYTPQASHAFVAELFAAHDPDSAGVVFLHDMAAYTMHHPPRLAAHLLLDGLTPEAIAAEFAKVDTDKSGGLSRAEVTDLLFAHGLPLEEAQTEADAFHARFGHVHPQAEVSLGEVYSDYMRRHRLQALQRLRALTLELFAAADTDGDGFLSRDEVRASAAQLLGPRIHASQVDLAVDRINVSGTGLVTANELFNWYYIEAGLHVEDSKGTPLAENPVSGPAYVHNTQ
jgi:Ca2+-binding EF-hand superfamily protein